MDYNERQALQGTFKRPKAAKQKKNKLLRTAHPMISEKKMFHTSVRRRLKDPEANNIPQEFVKLWTEAVEQGNKASYCMLDMHVLQTILHGYVSDSKKIR